MRYITFHRVKLKKIILIVVHMMLQELDITNDMLCLPLKYNMTIIISKQNLNTVPKTQF
jgi:hypothetical protein